MPGLDNLLLFGIASVLLVLTPGPNLLYLISRTLAQGRAAGLVSLAGTTTGFVVHILAAALGLSAILVAVPVAYDAVRWAGAAYLLWLAWDAVRPAQGGGTAAGAFTPRTLPRAAPAKLFRMGLLTSILNPKVALFYLALFPQFVEPARGSVFVQSLVLGLVQIVVAVIGDTLFVLAAARVARWLGARPVWAAAQRWLLGGVFAGIAAKLALDDRR
jgi:threonine/homoserine/homoserine lactone efflux protein